MHEDNNAFDGFANLPKCYNCRLSITWAFPNSKMIFIRQRSKDFYCFDIHSLPKVTLGSRRHRNSQKSESKCLRLYTASGRFYGACKNCVQWTNVTHHPWLIFGRWDWDWIFTKWNSWDKVTQNWKKSPLHVRDMFRRQKYSVSKRLRVEDKYLDITIID